MREMRKWAEENRKTILVSLAVVLAAFGVMLTCNTLAIDEEKSIIAGEGYSVWIAQGRFMIQLFNELFTVNGRYVPFLWDLLAVLTWFGSGVIYAFSLPGIRRRGSGAFGLFWFLSYYGTLPFVVGEVLSFSMYSFQVALGCMAAAVSFLLTVKLLELREMGEGAGKRSRLDIGCHYLLSAQSAGRRVENKKYSVWVSSDLYFGSAYVFCGQQMRTDSYWDFCGLHRFLYRVVGQQRRALGGVYGYRQCCSGVFCHYDPGCIDLWRCGDPGKYCAVYHLVSSNVCPRKGEGGEKPYFISHSCPCPVAFCHLYSDGDMRLLFTACG